MFSKTELSSSNITKVPYIFSKESFSCIFPKESFSYISEYITLHFSAQALNINFFYISGNGNPKKETLKSFSPKNEKYALKKFFVSYDVFAIFTSVDEISYNVKIKHYK